jgi:small-conductance mechanosensitive channel
MYPIVYDQTLPEQRNRLTVFFRGLMIIPLYVVAIFYGFAAFIVVAIAWLALLFTGSWPEGMYNFVSGWSRFSVRLMAYYLLLTDEYPPFDGGEHPEYPIRLQIAPAKESYSRAKVFFRYLLAIPIMIVNYVMTLWLLILAIAMWFAAVFTGRTGEGLTGATRMPMAYYARANAYLLLLTEDWPPFDPGQPAAAASPIVPPAAPGGLT